MPDLQLPPLPGAPPRPQSLADLRAVADEQRGLVTRQQGLAAGLSPRAIEGRLTSGRWVAVHRGVYLTSPGRDDWWMHALAASLACGPEAAWSHHTAAFVHGLLRTPPALVDVLVAHDHAIHAPTGTRVRRSRRVDDRVDPMRWPWRTTVEETILDLAEGESTDETFAVLGRAFQRGLTSQHALLVRLAQRARHPQRALLRLVLSDVADGAESAMEVRYLQDVERAHGLPCGVRQLSTERGRREQHDVGYPEQRVLVELDGRLGHEGRDARVRDGMRDRRSATSGWLTARAFWRDVAGLPCDLALEVGAILASRGWAGQPRPCRRAGCSVRRRPDGGRVIGVPSPPRKVVRTPRSTARDGE